MSGSTAQDDETMMESNSSGPGTPLVSNPGTPLVSNPGTPLVSNPGTPRSIDTEVRNTPPPGALANNMVSAVSAPQPPPPPVTTVNPAVMMMNIPRPQLPQSKYAQLLAVIEDMGKDIRPTYAGSRTSAERLKRGIVHARILVRECLMECERAART